jgi:hypothetical protein
MRELEGSPRIYLAKERIAQGLLKFSLKSTVAVGVVMRVE